MSSSADVDAVLVEGLPERLRVLDHRLGIALTPTHKFLQNILVSDIARDIVIFYANLNL